MNNNIIINYIYTLSSNENVQALLIKILGKILLNQDNIEFFLEKNNDKIIHIVDWITSVVEHEEEWTSPRVLTIDALNNTADKYFKKKNNQIKIIKLDENDEKLFANLGDYYIVQMLTPEALDNESKIMQHCVGHGGYDDKLEDHNYKYLSFRNKYNKAHVTMEIKNDKIIQLQGKQNRVPDIKYLEILLPWLIENNYKVNWLEIADSLYYINEESEENIDYFINKEIDQVLIIDSVNNDFKKILNVIRRCRDNYYILFNKNKFLIDFCLLGRTDYVSMFQKLVENGYKNIPFEKFNCVFNKVDNIVYSKYDLSDDVEIDDNLLLTYSSIEKLPKRLIVNGDLDLYRCQNLKEFSENIKIGGNLDICDTKIEKLPDNFFINGNFYLRECRYLDELPNNLVVNGDFILDSMNIITLPNEFVFNQTLSIYNCPNLVELPNDLILNGGLKLSNCNKLKQLPKGLVVENLVLEKGNIKEIPEDTKINSVLEIYKSKIEKLPDNLECKTLWINSGQTHLIKETMNFQNIIVDFYKHSICTKEKFFEKMKDSNGFAFY